MSEDERAKAQAATDDILAFAEEVAASGDVAVDGSELEGARAALHRWVDTVTGVVNMAAFGRVILLHGNGRQSTILSPELPFTMSKPVRWTPPE